MIVKSADPDVYERASLKKMLNEIEALLANGGYTLLTLLKSSVYRAKTKENRSYLSVPHSAFSASFF
jgi:hypothetical protein